MVGIAPPRRSPRLWAALRMVVPAGTLTAWPSMVKLMVAGMVWSLGFGRIIIERAGAGRHQAGGQIGQLVGADRLDQHQVGARLKGLGAVRLAGGEDDARGR